MSDDTSSRHVKKIPVGQLRRGMYIHDVNCGWMDHPFMSGQFLVKDDNTLRQIGDLGVREVYIDTSRGQDVGDAAPTQAEIHQEIRSQFESIAGEQALPQRVALAEEQPQAQKLHKAASQIVRNMIGDIRLGKQIEMEKVEPLVENMVDSIFRSPDALLPLAHLKAHDDYTFQHSVSVCTLLIAFARARHLDRATIKELAIGGLLHDVGKAKVPEAILNKPAKLSEAEFAKMKEHVAQSIGILEETPGISRIALEVAGQHHERHDGTGYPNRLKGEEISPYGGMGAIVDVYDAITSDRVYHKGMAPTAALGKLLEWSKFHFAPDMVRQFIKTVGIYPTGSLVRLESGRLGVVLEQRPETLMQPVVRVIYHAEGRRYLTPETVNLAEPQCRDRITGHESFDFWHIDAQVWMES